MAVSAKIHASLTPEDRPALALCGRYIKDPTRVVEDLSEVPDKSRCRGCNKAQNSEEVTATRRLRLVEARLKEADPRSPLVRDLKRLLEAV